MRKLAVFDQVSIDGYFTSPTGDSSWTHRYGGDPELAEFTAKSAGGGGVLVFGRVTYDLMVKFWPTPEAQKQFPDVAPHMNAHEKLVFSRTLDRSSWANTRVIRGDAVAAMRELKSESGKDMVILGSGSLVAQFAQAGLLDEIALMVLPVVLGSGRTLFDGVTGNLDMKLARSRMFKNGAALMTYEPKR